MNSERIEIWHHYKPRNVSEMVYATVDLNLGYKWAKIYLNNYAQSDGHYHQVFLNGSEISFKRLSELYKNRANHLRQIGVIPKHGRRL